MAATTEYVATRRIKHGIGKKQSVTLEEGQSKKFDPEKVADLIASGALVEFEPEPEPETGGDAE